MNRYKWTPTNQIEHSFGMGDRSLEMRPGDPRWENIAPIPELELARAAFRAMNVAPEQVPTNVETQGDTGSYTSYL